MKVLVCGGRMYNKQDHVFSTMDRWNEASCIEVIITGKAPGADRLAKNWARSRGIKVVEVPAEWPLHGRKAGPIRNQKMLDEEKPDLVVAFPGGKGTRDMVRRSRAAGVRTVEVEA